jgi:hypothetical protein
VSEQRQPAEQQHGKKTAQRAGSQEKQVRGHSNGLLQRKI